MTDLFPDIGVGEALAEFKVLSFKAQAAITKGDFVKMSTHTAGEIGSVTPCAGAGDIAIGMAIQSKGAGLDVSILIGGVVKVTASGAITIGVHVRTAAAGGNVVFADNTSWEGCVGIAVQTFADGDTGLILLRPT